MKSKLIYLAIIFISFSGCIAKFEGEKLDPSGKSLISPTEELLGLPFQLTKPQFMVKHIEKGDGKGKRDKFEIDLSYVPDPEHRYTVNIDPTILTDITFNTQFGDHGQITSSDSGTVEQVTPFIKSLGEFVSSLATGLASLGKSAIFDESKTSALYRIIVKYGDPGTAPGKFQIYLPVTANDYDGPRKLTPFTTEITEWKEKVVFRLNRFQKEKDVDKAFRDSYYYRSQMERTFWETVRKLNDDENKSLKMAFDKEFKIFKGEDKKAVGIKGRAVGYLETIKGLSSESDSATVLKDQKDKYDAEIKLKAAKINKLVPLFTQAQAFLAAGGFKSSSPSPDSFDFAAFAAEKKSYEQALSDFEKEVVKLKASSDRSQKYIKTFKSILASPSGEKLAALKKGYEDELKNGAAPYSNINKIFDASQNIVDSFSEKQLADFVLDMSQKIWNWRHVKYLEDKIEKMKRLELTGIAVSQIIIDEYREEHAKTLGVLKEYERLNNLNNRIAKLNDGQVIGPSGAIYSSPQIQSYKETREERDLVAQTLATARSNLKPSPSPAKPVELNQPETAEFHHIDANEDHSKKMETLKSSMGDDKPKYVILLERSYITEKEEVEK